MKNTLIAALRGIRYRGPALLAPALLFLLAACIPTVHGGHYRPSVAGQPARHFGVGCGDSWGAGEVIEVRGPSGVRVLARLRPVDTTLTRERLGGQVGIHAPAGTRVEIGDSGFAIARVDEGRERVERALVVDSVNVGPRTTTPWGYQGSGGWGHANAAFTRTLEGGDEGRIMWIEFDAGATAPRPREVVLRVPTLMVGGQAWSPGTITFRYRRSQLGIAPFNC
jgi:hypothetical protein